MCGTSKDDVDSAMIKTNGNNHIQVVNGKSIELEYYPIFSTVLRAAEYFLQQTNGDMALAKINFD